MAQELEVYDLLERLEQEVNSGELEAFCMTQEQARMLLDYIKRIEKESAIHLEEITRLRKGELPKWWHADSEFLARIEFVDGLGLPTYVRNRLLREGLQSHEALSALVKRYEQSGNTHPLGVKGMAYLRKALEDSGGG